MTPYAQMLLAQLPANAQGAFDYDYRRYAKDSAVAFVLTILFGVVGGEAYYMGSYKRGILMTIALFTGVGLFVTVPMWIARCFTIMNECETYNDYLAYSLACRFYQPQAQTPEPPVQSATQARPTIAGVPMRA